MHEQLLYIGSCFRLVYIFILALGCWGKWTPWSSCMPSSVCYKSMERTRSCDRGFGIFDDCKGSDRESQSCTVPDPDVGG